MNNVEEKRLYLAKKYGNSNLIGFSIIVYILSNYKFPIVNIMLMYDEIGFDLNMTGKNIERNIRYYKEKVGFKKITNECFIDNLLIENENRDRIEVK